VHAALARWSCRTNVIQSVQHYRWDNGNCRTIENDGRCRRWPYVQVPPLCISRRYSVGVLRPWRLIALRSARWPEVTIIYVLFPCLYHCTVTVSKRIRSKLLPATRSTRRRFFICISRQHVLVTAGWQQLWDVMVRCSAAQRLGKTGIDAHGIF